MLESNYVCDRLVNERNNMNWLFFALLTVVSWGVYGVMLHQGQRGMADKESGRYMAFLWVGIAYFLVAIIGPIVLLKIQGGRLDFWAYPTKGLWWSLIAGTFGAVGAFGVLLAFGAKGTPAVVMSIVFAGAPVVNAFYSLLQHPPAGGWSSIKPQFYLGILLAAVGGCLVTFYKPAPATAPAKVPAQSASINPHAR
jgi:drug/metabolite transporter (DMT)-like permease